jgi:hypothetical protein
MWLDRAVVFSECLTQVAEMGCRYRGSPQDADAAILLVNCSSLLKHVVAEDGKSGNGQLSGASMSDGRGMLLVGVVSNLLKATGHTVSHHHGNWPRFSSHVSRRYWGPPLYTAY